MPASDRAATSSTGDEMLALKDGGARMAVLVVVAATTFLDLIPTLDDGAGDEERSSL